MGCEGGVDLEHVLGECQLATVVENELVALSPELVEYDGAENVPGSSHCVRIETVRAADWNR